MTIEAEQRTVEETSDDDIVLRILDQEDLGVRLLLEKFGGRVKAFLRRQFGAKLDEEDRIAVLHHAACRVWQYIGSFDDSRGSLGAWFVAIAQNVANDLLGKERLALVSLEVEPLAHSEPVPLTPEGLKLREDLERVVSQLPPGQRAVVKEDLRCGGEACGPELSDKLGMTPNAIRVARCKAKKFIFKEMQQLAKSTEGE